MSYRTFVVPEEKNLELYRKLLEFYGTKKTTINEEDEKEIRLVYPTGIIGDIELHAYIPKIKTPSNKSRQT